MLNPYQNFAPNLNELIHTKKEFSKLLDPKLFDKELSKLLDPKLFCKDCMFRKCCMNVDISID